MTSGCVCTLEQSSGHAPSVSTPWPRGRCVGTRNAACAPHRAHGRPRAAASERSISVAVVERRGGRGPKAFDTREPRPSQAEGACLRLRLRRRFGGAPSTDVAEGSACRGRSARRTGGSGCCVGAALCSGSARHWFAAGALRNGPFSTTIGRRSTGGSPRWTGRCSRCGAYGSRCGARCSRDGAYGSRCGARCSRCGACCCGGRTCSRCAGLWSRCAGRCATRSSGRCGVVSRARRPSPTRRRDSSRVTASSSRSKDDVSATWLDARKRPVSTVSGRSSPRWKRSHISSACRIGGRPGMKRERKR